jgi:hypothetical protein
MELRETLEQTGVFGSVRTWYLDGDSPEAVIGSADGSGAPHRPRELVDPSGRQIILVLSDCVGGAWRSGSALRALDLWGRSGPAAIVQPLPQELWDRSPVGCHHVQLGAAPGLPNHRLAVWWDDLLLAEERPAGVPVPVLELEPDWFAAWAGLITGGLRRTHLIAAFTGEQPALADEVAADGFAEPGQRRAVQRFMSSASPEAFRLAGLLAAAPLNLPMMRHIQQAMQPAGRSAHLAEVYLSGLLRVTQASGAEREYEFISGVRELLLDTVRRSEVIKVGELVSAELDRTYGTAGRGYTAGSAVATPRRLWPRLPRPPLRRALTTTAQPAARSRSWSPRRTARASPTSVS